ncbi:hypothetical protein [Dyadobacter aurulentus]|uniref:hypothetical protein n=1 Tax=Dyadobacter sp. UC 10 TaxID=2605428 RepID=UPI0011F3D668|nr:hypothetical protein [Dyadobacter sp. UC 10]KAA0990478.1 hypothetical protein FXO21_10080 [Dyadobacter sp. UC 10]
MKNLPTTVKIFIFWSILIPLFCLIAFLQMATTIELYQNFDEVWQWTTIMLYITVCCAIIYGFFFLCVRLSEKIGIKGGLLKTTARVLATIGFLVSVWVIFFEVDIEQTPLGMIATKTVMTFSSLFTLYLSFQIGKAYYENLKS